MAEEAANEAAAGPPATAPKLNMDFALWALTIVPAGLAVLCFVINFGGYLFNAAMGFLSAHLWIIPIAHVKLLEASFVFATFAIAMHYFRVRLRARREATYKVQLPDPLVARSLGGDEIMEKYECIAKVELHVQDREASDAVTARLEDIVTALESGLSIAISDPVTRFSKNKIEHVLRLSVAEILPLEKVAGVGLNEMRQRRIPREELMDQNGAAKGPKATSRKTAQETPDTAEKPVEEPAAAC